MIFIVSDKRCPHCLHLQSTCVSRLLSYSKLYLNTARLVVLVRVVSFSTCIKGVQLISAMATHPGPPHDLRVHICPDLQAVSVLFSRVSFEPPVLDYQLEWADSEFADEKKLDFRRTAVSGA